MGGGVLYTGRGDRRKKKKKAKKRKEILRNFFQYLTNRAPYLKK